MRTLLAFALFGGLTVHGDPNPTYLGPTTGLVLNSFTSTDDFSLEPGTIQKCTRKTISDWVIYKCSVEGTTAKVTSATGSRTFQFTEMQAWFRYHKSVGFFNEYHFTGQWSDNAKGVALDSQVNLTLWHPRKTPKDLKGTLTLKRYGLSLPVQATQ